MESANLHHQHHQLQENLATGSSSLAIPSCYGVPTNHAWTPITSFSSTSAAGNSSNSSFNEVVISSLRDSRQKSDEVLALSTSTTRSNMVPAATDDHHLGFHHWPPTTAHDLQHLAKIKQELSSSSSSSLDISFPKITQMLMSTTTTSLDDYHLFPSSTSTISSCGLINNIKNEQKDHQLMNDLTEKLLLRTLSSSVHHRHQISAGDHQFYSNHHCNDQLGGHHAAAMPSRPGQFSQIYPSINISNLNHSSSSSTISSNYLNLDMNLRAMDVLANSGRFSQPNSHEGDIDSFGMYKDRQYSFGHHQQMQQSNDDHRLSRGNTSTHILSCFENDQITTSSSEVKRPGSLIGPKLTQAAAPKKSRLESRNSCPPFKVRKEKLGDRIAALQQLVAPFGKTDTASVLMEAIGYIKFLQSQVETLSVPYMKSSRNKQSTTTKIMQGSATENGNGDQTKRDLRSRGLCLVPLSCMSYVAGDVTGGGNVWPTPNFGGGGT